jgi:hypothetical protein
MMSRKKMLLLPVVLFFLCFLSACSAAHSLPPDAFPSVNEYKPPSPPMRVNIYIQGTSDMADLIDEADSLFTNTITTLKNLTLRPPTQSYFYRFDVQWLEFAAEVYREHGAFAYPLDPSWWHRPAHFMNQIDQITDKNFFSVDWYTQQPGRGEYLYRNVATENARFLSSVIREIDLLRDGAHEISVVVTNFLGHAHEQSEVQALLTQYLYSDPHRAIAVFTFENGVDSFFFIIMGASREVVEFSQMLRNEKNDHDFRLYAKNLPFMQISYNNSISTPDTPAFGPGVRLAFDSEKESDLERNMFVVGNETGWIFYTLLTRFIEDDIARLTLNTRLDLLPFMRNDTYINFTASISELIVFEGDQGMVTVPIGASDVNKSSLDHDGNLQLNIELDTSNLVSGNRGRFAVQVHGSLNHAHRQTFSENIRTHRNFFIDAFEYLEDYLRHWHNENENQLVSELYVHFWVNH